MLVDNRARRYGIGFNYASFHGKDIVPWIAQYKVCIGANRAMREWVREFSSTANN
jgi:hypothetical protein